MQHSFTQVYITYTTKAYISEAIFFFPLNSFLYLIRCSGGMIPRDLRYIMGYGLCRYNLLKILRVIGDFVPRLLYRRRWYCSQGWTTSYYIKQMWIIKKRQANAIIKFAELEDWSHPPVISHDHLLISLSSSFFLTSSFFLIEPPSIDYQQVPTHLDSIRNSSSTHVPIFTGANYI